MRLYAYSVRTKDMVADFIFFSAYKPGSTEAATFIPEAKCIGVIDIEPLRDEPT